MGSKARLLGRPLCQLRAKEDDASDRQEMLNVGVVADLYGWMAFEDMSCDAGKIEVLDFLCKLACYGDSPSDALSGTVQPDVITDVLRFPRLVQLEQSSCPNIRMGGDMLLDWLFRGDYPEHNLDRNRDIVGAVEHLASSDSLPQRGALMVLGAWAWDEASARDIMQAGGIPFIAQLLLSDHSTSWVQALAARALRNLSYSPACRHAIAQELEGGVQTLVGHLQTGDDEACWFVVELLSNLAKDEVAARATVDAGCITALLKCLESDRKRVYSSALCILCRMVPSNSFIVRRLAEAGGIKALTSIVQCNDQRLQSAERILERILDVMVVSATAATEPIVRNMLESEDYKQQLAALCILSCCCKRKAVQQEFAEDEAGSIIEEGGAQPSLGGMLCAV